MLRVNYNDYDSSFNELCEIENNNTIYDENMTVIYKFLNGLSPAIMSEIFKQELLILLKKPEIINN